MPTENATMFDQVAEVIEKLRPFLLRDGGDCSLVDVEDGIVKLQLHGACGTCPSSTITLKAGIERALHEEVPGVVEVEQVVSYKEMKPARYSTRVGFFVFYLNF